MILQLATLFSDHMVVQRDKPIPVWGAAAAGDTIRVQLGTQQAVAVTDASGQWEVALAALPAGGPHTLTVSGPDSLVLTDILVGDVWVCGGHSNMEWSFRKLAPAYEEVVRTADHARIRLLDVERSYSFAPQNDVVVVPTTYDSILRVEKASEQKNGITPHGLFAYNNTP